MEQSLSMQFVTMRAEAEAKAAHSKEIGVEHVFLGLLKIAEVTSEQLFNVPEFIAKQINEDINTVAELFETADIDTSRTRALLRYMVSNDMPIDKQLLNQYLDLATERAKQRGQKMLWCQDILLVILEKPTDNILQVCPLKNDGTINIESSEKNLVDEMSKDFLPELTNRIRHMRAQLLSNVFGQDHVVHAFAEGMFAAEVLAASDEKRKRPRAIFVFAGPPGVGKTFLAEQAAEALNIPFKRFDMSSYADYQSYTNLVGFEKSYHGAKKGVLTGFVKKNPHSILLFDEIEKAHLNTTNQFLQILDAGRLTDKYLDEDISFRDTIIIFTTNAGKTLYDGETQSNAAGVPHKIILNALETEINPLTGQPFFPETITSRMATGWPLLFNHLQAHHLERISAGEFAKFCALFEKQYNMKVKFDNLVPTSLMLQEGGLADARTLRAQTELFFKNEIFKVCRLWGEDNFATALKKINSIHFTVETDKFTDEVRQLFFSTEKPEILLYSDNDFAEKCKEEMPNYIIHHTQNMNQALDIAGEKDIRLVLIDIAKRNKTSEFVGYTFPNASPNEYSVLLRKIDGAFDYAPMASGEIQDATQLFRKLHERLPELPVYLLESDDFLIDTELEMSFVRAGARGKLSAPKEDFSVFEDMIDTISRKLYIQGIATKMASERKALYFETAPKLLPESAEVIIRLRNFSLKRAVAADDMDSILDDIEKPDIRFADVIGASDAKDELKFFIDYLKNPKRFTAQGIEPPKGVLLYGPPGTGKTMLAKAMAGESDVTFIPCVATSFVTKYQGSGPESIRTLFKKARKYAPSIIFIDEIDAIGRKRGEINSGHGEEMALNALLAEMDGFAVDPKRPVFVLAATNFEIEEGHKGMGVIDPALSRRFDCKIMVDLPNSDERELLIRLLLSKNKQHLVTEDMIKRLASRSMGMSPSSLTSVIEAANRIALKGNTIVDDIILDEAYETTKHGVKKDWGYDYLYRVAIHESGHALINYLNGEIPAYLTIVARGEHGGYMEHSSDEIEPLSTKDELLARIQTALGGRAAEMVYFGKDKGISTGASNDIRQATKIASAMICAYGMDDEIGIGFIDSDEEKKSPNIKAKINEILKDQLAHAVQNIKSNKSKMDKLVEELMNKNKLNGNEIEYLLKTTFNNE